MPFERDFRATVPSAKRDRFAARSRGRRRFRRGIGMKEVSPGPAQRRKRIGNQPGNLKRHMKGLSPADTDLILRARRDELVDIWNRNNPSRRCTIGLRDPTRVIGLHGDRVECLCFCP
jgi:hypothetical protein